MFHSATATAAAAPPRPAAAGTRRRAVDVVVLGSSLHAYAAAYLLARRGKRTVLVDSATPQQAPAPGSRADDLVLHLPASTPHLVNEATEALALWRGIEAISGARDLLHMCGSIDVAPAGSGAAAAALSAMQEASQAAGLQFAMLASEEVTAALPRLRPPRGSAALFANLGGTVHGQVAAAALAAMAQRAGADVAPAGRCLLGWRDGGSHFAIRTAACSAAAVLPPPPRGEEAVVYECEQLLLLPVAAAQRHMLAVFGLSVPGATLWRVPASSWSMQEECAALPVWQLLGTGSSRTVDDPSAIDSCWGLPPLDWFGLSGGAFVAQSLADGQPAEEAEQQQQQADDGGSVSSTQQLLEGQAAAAVLGGGAPSDFAELAACGVVERSGSEEAVDAGRQAQAQQRQQQELAEERLVIAGSLAARLMKGVGSRLTGRDSLLQCIVTPDGESAVGSHPGYEPGRIVAAFPATSTGLGCLPGGQLAPLVAHLALSELLGQTPEAVDAALVALGREALQAEAAALQHDSWAGLSQGL